MNVTNRVVILETSTWNSYSECWFVQVILKASLMHVGFRLWMDAIYQ
jgi:hypothetical protein